MRANRRINRTKKFKITITSDRTLILRDAFESKIFDSVFRLIEIAYSRLIFIN